MRILIFILSLMPFCALAQPSIEEQVAQMLMIGFNNQELSKENPIYEDIKTGKIGGVILFSDNVDASKPSLQKNIKNPEQLKKLINDLQSISKVPLFVGIDQEGGVVSRLNNSFDVSTLSAQELGKTNNKKLTYKEALKTASQLKDVGININFAPVVDVNINKNSPIAKKQRIFSDNQDVVTKHAIEVIKAHQKKNILPVLKHFPGHGSAKQDTHEGFVDVTKTFDKKELKPYIDILNKYPKIGVMTTHVYNANIDKNLPLSLSKNSIDGILKKEIGFKGLVFSDDLNMGALSKHYSWQEVLINAINAGTDILVIGNNLSYNPNIAKQSIDIIKEAIKNGQISPERIKNSYNKIIQLKKDLK